MIRFKRKFYFWKVQDTWFQYQYSIKDLFRLSMYSYVQRTDQKPRFCVKDINYTVENSLEAPMEEIVGKFRKANVQGIRKAEQLGIVCSFREDLDTYIPFFNAFAKTVNLYPAQRDMIESIGKNFETSFAELNGDLLVAHSYIVDESVGVARLFQSGSRRHDEQYDRNIIGHANKMLTMKDMEYFKQRGIKIMDFGGYAEGTTNKSLMGINEFKLSFGGEKVACTNYLSWPFFILRKLSQLLDRRYA